jgi:hypothetical protein
MNNIKKKICSKNIKQIMLLIQGLDSKDVKKIRPEFLQKYLLQEINPLCIINVSKEGIYKIITNYVIQKKKKIIY